MGKKINEIAQDEHASRYRNVILPNSTLWIQTWNSWGTRDVFFTAGLVERFKKANHFNSSFNKVFVRRCQLTHTHTHTQDLCWCRARCVAPAEMFCRIPELAEFSPVDPETSSPDCGRWVRSATSFLEVELSSDSNLKWIFCTSYLWDRLSIAAVVQIKTQIQLARLSQTVRLERERRHLPTNIKKTTTEAI